jgi:peptide/nickel transport system substrate-binding protein
LGIPLNSVYDTLVFLDPESGTFIPGLAEHWEISEDGEEYTFYLREDVDFHDGTHFDASAAKANFDYVLSPENNSLKAASMLGPISHIQVLDTYVVQIQLAQPFAPLLDSLSQVYLGMASPQALETWGPSEYQFHQVGTGPYTFVEYLPDDHLTLARNPEYNWGPAIYDKDSATIETIQFTFYEDPATRALALERGDVHIMGEIPERSATRLSASPEFTLYPVPIPGQPLQYFFNSTRFPTDELLIRQALTIAINRTQIVETVFGTHSNPATSILSADTPGYSEYPDWAIYDPDFAAELLDQAGWMEFDSDGYRMKAGVPLQVDLVAPPWGSNPEVAQLIEASWESIGVEVRLRRALGFGDLNEIRKKDEYHAIGLNFFGSDPDLLQSFYSSTGFYNWSNVQDPTLDTLLLQASEMFSDPMERDRIYDQINTLILDQWLVLPIRDYVNLVVADASLEGLKFSAQGWFPYLIDLSFSQ